MNTPEVSAEGDPRETCRSPAAAGRSSSRWSRTRAHFSPVMQDVIIKDSQRCSSVGRAGERPSSGTTLLPEDVGSNPKRDITFFSLTTPRYKVIGKIVDK